MSDKLDDLPLEPVDSPCKLVCSIDKESDRCFGCGRSPDEIAYWPLKTQEERDTILAELPARMPPLTAKLMERRKKRRVNRRNRSSSAASD
ncbi:MAG: DUF1289 domain-containing protein [Maricaulaceae bacterium]